MAKRHLPKFAVVAFFLLIMSCGPGGGLGGRLIIGIGDEPPHLDATYIWDASTVMLGTVLEPLVWQDKDLKLKPHLAESWQQVDPTTWRFKIRRGVRFHNGKEMTADDVVASINWAVDPKRNAPNLSLIGNINGATKVDDSTVDVKTSKIQTSTPARMFYVLVVPKEVIERDPESLKTNPVGTGPYRLSQWNRGVEIRLSRFDGYWGKAPQFDEVVYRIIPEPSVRLQALQAGEIDVTALPSADLAKQAPKFIARPISKVVGVRIDTIGPGPLKNRSVRLALNLAIDREAIARQIFAGLSKPTGELVPATTPGHLGLQPYPYDPERARQLIREAGAAGTTLTMACWGEHPQYGKAWCEAVANMIQAVGLKVDLKILDVRTWLTQGVYGNPSNGFADPPFDLVAIGHDDYFLDPFRNTDSIVTCNSRYGTFCDPGLDALVEQARNEPNADRQLQMFREINRRFHEEIPWLIVGTLVNFYGAREGIDWPGREDEFIMPTEVSVAG
jgi:peptide/nickel transport system substrate-binding protein